MSVRRRPPYLPFLAGPPQFVVGLKPIEPGAWLDPDTEAHAIPEKRALMAARLVDVYAETPGSEAAQSEAARLVGAARAITTDEFLVAGALVSDDLCLMQRSSDGWRLAAALLCAPSLWRLDENIGGPLTQLHGPVPDALGPDGGQGLAPRITRIFDALAPGQILERFNWTIQAGPDRYAPTAAPLRARAHAARAEEAGRILHLRVERQTIRKLPASGAVLFTIRVCLDPLAAALSEASARAGFARAWESAPAHVRAYKNWAPLDRLVHAVLET